MRVGHGIDKSKLRKDSPEVNENEITDLLTDMKKRMLKGFSQKLEFRNTINVCVTCLYSFIIYLCSKLNEIKGK